MDFNYFLTSYLPNKEYGGKRLYHEMVEQAVLAERLGFRAVSIPEHHLVNILLVPSPLQLAVKIAALTERVEIMTSIVVLPVRDMRVFAGEAVQADMLCDGRLVLGVGRGAFAYELERLGVPMSETRARFDESLAVLQALLTQEEVSWDGEFYQFAPLTVMPRPMRPLPLMVAAMAPEGIYHCAKQGFNIQTTPLQASHEVLLQQVAAFHRGKADAGARGEHLRLSLQRPIYLATDAADAREKLALTYEYYKRFDNVFSGPGVVTNGLIEALPRKQTLEEMAGNILICPPAEMIDRLGQYAEAGIDEVIFSAGFGQSHEETSDMMQRFARDVMPHFAARKVPEAASVA
ncbi:LLM class flavin-dependent oxidoreductase [Paraburkholderia bonniea]|uniref:LLM class flavin-dependent oxidoreductase n=1 Tax=Paraburkholderia bonniea TaxID=2152891 RepID=UPI00129238F6|nr:LLM class flavin-dependent oxidoreductase [Paraburkholderia bonniea]WJF90864.1 LLM class flavin-dependent oxidoreductase [Paraburkholderia bonniea]WJF94178.1 LLM class flavin-dependent oxidoreductase [Paraburkholderia bonniea]